MAIIAAAVAASVHAGYRWLRSLIHSIRATWPNR